MGFDQSILVEQSFRDVDTVEELNEAISNGSFPELIKLSEAYQDKRIVEIANDIKDKKRRVVLIAGPSSSGKTTFAKKLCIQLEVNGLKPLYMGTDDYFCDRENTPIDEKGEYDFETIKAVEVELFNENISDLISGKEVDLPTFDFKEGKKIFGQRITKMAEDQVLVIEGIHALNDDLTHLINKKDKYRIFICPIVPINVSHSDLNPLDYRIFRRMIRDFDNRGNSPETTILSWPKVRKGEEENIFPYVPNADAVFNTAHLYEISVLKLFIRPLLNKIKPDSEAYEKAVSLKLFLEPFEEFNDLSYIPNDSIIREFIGGSAYHEDLAKLQNKLIARVIMSKLTKKVRQGLKEEEIKLDGKDIFRH